MEKINKLEIQNVKFNGVDIICPCVNGVPYVILYHIISDIGLNERSVRRRLNTNKRLHNKLIYIKIQNWGAETALSFTKIAEKDPFLKVSGTESVPLKSMKGYKYLALPLNKLSAWLFSIDSSKVKEDIKPTLELYQDECDEVLFNHFVGDRSLRGELVKKKRVLTQRQLECEKVLLENGIYIEYLQVKKEFNSVKKALEKLDDNVSTGTSLFDSNIEDNILMHRPALSNQTIQL